MTSTNMGESKYGTLPCTCGHSLTSHHYRRNEGHYKCQICECKHYKEQPDLIAAELAARAKYIRRRGVE